MGDSLLLIQQKYQGQFSDNMRLIARKYLGHLLLQLCGSFLCFMLLVFLSRDTVQVRYFMTHYGSYYTLFITPLTDLAFSKHYHTFYRPFVSFTAVVHP